MNNVNRRRDLLERTRMFALRIIRLYSALPKTTEAQVLGRQILRSGTSAGAHLREGKRSRSDAEFISKIEGALQELEETAYWLELLAQAGIVKLNLLTDLMKEADELTAILVTSTKTVKKRKSKS
ncbi:MAG: four helix bundle protein [Acidobacteria bacterium]|nr:four helix bundle protein [Acidobacteriota bacterium]